MKIEPKDIGNYVNKFVWICDYRYNDYLQKPIRKVLPQKVMVKDNQETNKRIYYSEYHFCGLDKNDESLKSKIIGIYDNTGYRGYEGVPLNIFDNKEECYECFYNLCDVIIKEFIKIRENIYNELTSKVNKLWEVKDEYKKDENINIFIKYNSEVSIN